MKYILIKDADYFGQTIPKGAVFKQWENDKDWYRLFMNDDGIVMEKPAINLHFTTVKCNELFVPMYG